MGWLNALAFPNTRRSVAYSDGSPQEKVSLGSESTRVRATKEYVQQTADGMEALIISGRADGTTNERWPFARRFCKLLGLAGTRSRAMYITMPEYKNVCGDHTKVERWGRTE